MAGCEAVEIWRATTSRKAGEGGRGRRRQRREAATARREVAKETAPWRGHRPAAPCCTRCHRAGDGRYGEATELLLPAAPRWGGRAHG
jgi:hypothetical protein